MIKNKKKAMLYVCKVCITVLVFFILIYPWWMSADARWARDNLRYLNSRMNDSEMTDFLIPEWQLNIMTEAQLVGKVCEIADSWTNGYILAIEIVGDRTGEYDINMDKTISLNPYDTLSRLVLAGNDERLSKIYLAVQYDAAVLNPDVKLTKAEITQWKNDVWDARREADLLLTEIAKESRNQILAGLFIIAILWLVHPVYRVLEKYVRNG